MNAESQRMTDHSGGASTSEFSAREKEREKKRKGEGKERKDEKKNTHDRPTHSS
jgi:hypothetical protein